MADSGSFQGDSRNIPEVDEEMLTLFFVDNPHKCRSENSGKKSERCSDYGDAAIGRVEVKREKTLCITKCQVFPEFEVQKKVYKVTVVIDDAEEKIISSHCEDCPPSQVGCKHSVAFLFWLYRRTVMPCTTHYQSYWDLPLNAHLDPSIPFITAKDLKGSTDSSEPESSEDDY